MCLFTIYFFSHGEAEVSPKLPVPYTLPAFYPTFHMRHKVVLDSFYLSMNELLILFHAGRTILTANAQSKLLRSADIHTCAIGSSVSFEVTDNFLSCQGS